MTTTIQTRYHVSDDITDVVIACTDVECSEEHVVVNTHKRMKPTDVFRYHVDDDDDVICTYEACTRKHVDDVTAGVLSFCRMLRTPSGRFTHDRRALNFVHNDVTGENSLPTATLVYNDKCWHCNPTKRTYLDGLYKAFSDVNPYIPKDPSSYPVTTVPAVTPVTPVTNQPPKKRAVTLDERQRTFMHVFEVDVLNIEKRRWFTRLMKEFQIELGYDIKDGTDVRKFFFTEDPKELHATYNARMKEACEGELDAKEIAINERKRTFMHVFKVDTLDMEKIRQFTRLMMEFQIELGYHTKNAADVRKFFFTEDPKELYAMYQARKW
jgi:hypothetical protein